MAKGRKVLLLGLFAIAMAYLEGVVVVYIRKILSLEAVDLSLRLVEEISSSFILIEQTREAATIIMLVSLSLLVGERWRGKLAVFLFTFALWDIFYYLSLYLLLRWPPSLKTVDCLFLIPCPWIAPVYLPLAISGLMLVISLSMISKLKRL